MSKVFVSNWMSLDGIFSGPAGDTSWFTSDDELDQYNLQQLQRADAILLGRTTYELMHSYWPTPQAKHDFPEAWRYMNGCRKHIFSTTIQSSDWSNCSFYKAVNRETIDEIKASAAEDLVLLGSGEIAMQLHHIGVVDEFHILLDPQIKSEGKKFFSAAHAGHLNLVCMKKFGCGITYLQYSVVK